jgi:hypothetical protein
MKIRWPLALIVMLAVPVFPSHADGSDELRQLRDTTINLVRSLVQKGVLDKDTADQLIAQAQRDAQAPPPAPAGGSAGAAAGAEQKIIRVPYIPESVKRQIGAEVKQEVLTQAKQERWGEPGALPAWLGKLTINGDMRFRYEADRFPTDNAPNVPATLAQQFGINLANTTEPDNRLRVRARLGVEAAVSDSVQVGIRLATGGVGTGSNPDSENQTLGNYNARSAVGFDRAYLAYHPGDWFAIEAGRLGNPFLTPTSLLWADDLSLEGLVSSVRPRLGERVTLFATAGAFPIQQISPTPLNSAKSKWLYGYQAGVDWHWHKDSALRFGLGLFNYSHVEGIPNPSIFSSAYSATAAPFRQSGNSVFDINGLLNTQNGTQNYLWGLASKFRELNAAVSLDLGLNPHTHVIFNGDVVRNIGFKHQEILNRTGFDVLRQINGWQTSLSVGAASMRLRHAWQALVGYRYVQRDAVLDAFTDSDFHLGGTDAKGFYVGARWALAANSTLGFRWMSAKQIDGVALAGADQITGLPLAIDVALLDFAAAF